MFSSDLTSSIVLIATEILAVIFLCVFMSWILQRILSSLFSTAVLKQYKKGAVSARRNLRLFFLILGFLLSLGIVGFNAYLVYQEQDPLQFILTQVQRITPELWMQLAIAALKLIGLVIVTSFALRLTRTLLDYFCTRSKAYEGIRANDASIDQFFSTLKQVLTRAAWLLVLAGVANFLSLPSTAQEILITAISIYLIVAIGWLLWRAADAIVATLEALAQKYATTKGLLRYYDKLKPLVPLLRRTVETLIYLTVATLVAKQVEVTAPLAVWGTRLILILGIFFISRVAIEILALLLEEALVTRPELSPTEKQRRVTFVPLGRSALKYGIYFVFVILSLKQLGVNPMPILAGAGILGLAVGFGAQSLISDIVAGFFILFEEHYLIGDNIRIGNAMGVVEAIDLRTTRIRQGNGHYHIIRNGQITAVINRSKEYVYAVVEVGVSYASDLDKVIHVLENVGKKIHATDDRVLEPTEVEGLDAFGESELVMRTITKVKPGKLFPVERAVRKLIKEAFDENGIEIPFPHRVLLHDKSAASQLA